MHVIRLMPYPFSRILSGLRAVVLSDDKLPPPCAEGVFEFVELDFEAPGDTFELELTGRVVRCRVVFVVRGWHGLARGYSVVQFKVEGE